MGSCATAVHEEYGNQSTLGSISQIVVTSLTACCILDDRSGRASLRKGQVSIHHTREHSDGTVHRPAGQHQRTPPPSKQMEVVLHGFPFPVLNTFKQIADQLSVVRTRDQDRAATTPGSAGCFRPPLGTYASTDWKMQNFGEEFS